MREIKFRGRRSDTGEWIIGDLCTQHAQHSTLIGVWNRESRTCDWEPVDEETVGQFTGIKDLNKKELCEGDICAYSVYANWMGFHKDGSDSRMIGVVSYGQTGEYRNGGDHHAGAFYLQLVDKSKFHDSVFHPANHIHLSETCTTWGLEVIGNIHVTPELIETRTE